MPLQVQLVVVVVVLLQPQRTIVRRRPTILTTLKLVWPCQRVGIKKMNDSI